MYKKVPRAIAFGTFLSLLHHFSSPLFQREREFDIRTNVVLVLAGEKSKGNRGRV
jgi:hypothetical protein